MLTSVYLFAVWESRILKIMNYYTEYEILILFQIGYSENRVFEKLCTIVQNMRIRVAYK